MFKELKKAMFKELKKRVTSMNEQIEILNWDIGITFLKGPSRNSGVKKYN